MWWLRSAHFVLWVSMCGCMYVCMLLDALFSFYDTAARECLHTYTCAYIQTYIHTHVSSICVHIGMCVYLHIHMHTHTHTHIYIFIYTCAGLGMGFPKTSPLVEPFNSAIQKAFQEGTVVKYRTQYKLRESDFDCFDPQST
jgi:hypothetical protein